MVKTLPSNAGGMGSIPSQGTGPPCCEMWPKVKHTEDLGTSHPCGEKEMATHSSVPGESQGRGSLVAAVYGVAQSRARLKRLSSSSSSTITLKCKKKKNFTELDW